MAIDVAIVWVRLVRLAETEGQMLGDRYVQSKPLDEARILGPGARPLSSETIARQRKSPMKWMLRCAGMVALALSLNHTASGTSGAPQRDPVDYVSPNIGGIGQLLTATVPYVQ